MKNRIILILVTGLVQSMQVPIMVNATVVMLPEFEMKKMLEAIVKYKITDVGLVPPLAIRLVRDAIVKEYDLSHVRKFSSGAAPLSNEIIQEIHRRFPQAFLRQGYGMTESCSCLVSIPSPLWEFTKDIEYGPSVGMICPSTTLKIVDENGNELGLNQPGEILGKGPQVRMTALFLGH